MAYTDIAGNVVTDADIESMYVNMLDECNDEVRIGTLTYSPSYVLSSVDPIAYRIGLSEYVDSLIDDETIFETR